MNCESYNYLKILDYDEAKKMNYSDEHCKAIKINTYYTGRINDAIEKLKNYRDDEKIEYGVPR